MTASSDRPPIRLGLPKGRMQEEVVRLLADAGIRLAHGPREYRPRISLEGYEVKFLKPQNMVEMLQEGSRDIGFAGADWVAELDLDLVELLDTGLNPIRLVAATTAKFLEDGDASDKPFVVATEFANLTRAWLEDSKREGRILRAFGATEVFPPEDADYIVDVTATGATLEANDLIIVDELMTSSTRLYANPRLLEDAGRRDRIERFVMVLRAVLEARKRVMVEVNVPADRLDELIKVMPCMREPTVSSLNAGKGYAVKAAVPREVLAQTIPEIKACGGTDIVVTEIAQIVP